jgi:Kef-type K+ transport system membrane component KefB
VLLSSDGFGRARPAGSRWLFPAATAQSRLLAGVAQIGLLLLSFVLGVETDIALLRRLGHALAVIGSWSFVVPLAGGALLGTFLPARFIRSSGSRAALVVLLAGALAVSSLPVIAWVARELGISSSRVGKLAVALAEGNGTSRLVEARGPTPVIAPLSGRARDETA